MNSFPLFLFFLKKEVVKLKEEMDEVWDPLEDNVYFDDEGL
jgi:hypothetical protein